MFLFNNEFISFYLYRYNTQQKDCIIFYKIVKLMKNDLLGYV